MNAAELTRATEYIQKHYYTQVIGFTASQKEIILPDLVRSNDRLVIVAFRSNRKLRIALGEVGKKVDTELNESTTLLYTTTFQARRILQTIPTTSNLYLFMSDVDVFDPNAYGIWLLWKKLQFSLVILTVSPNSWLPVPAKGTEYQVYVGQDLITIAYDPTITTKLGSLNRDFVVIGNTPVGNLRMVKAEGEYYPGYDLVVDLQFTTQHEAYLREDLIDSGKIIRGITSKRFQQLPTRSPTSQRGDIRKVLASLLAKHQTNVLQYIDKHYSSQLEEVKRVGNDKNVLSIVANLPVEYDASYFLAVWLFKMSVMKQKGTGEGALTAAGYYGTVVAVLINEEPDYGDLSEFLGNDNLETLMNFWTAIMVNTRYTAYALTPDTERYLESWCKLNNLHTAKVFRLCHKVGKTLRFVLDVALLRKHSKILTSNQRVEGINRIRTTLGSVYPRQPARTYIIRNTLPVAPWSTIGPDTLITPLNRRGKHVSIYLKNIKLTPQTIAPITESSLDVSLDVLDMLDAVDSQYN
jgi:hypothetical protein